MTNNRDRQRIEQLLSQVAGLLSNRNTTGQITHPADLAECGAWIAEIVDVASGLFPNDSYVMDRIRQEAEREAGFMVGDPILV